MEEQEFKEYIYELINKAKQGRYSGTSRKYFIYDDMALRGFFPVEWENNYSIETFEQPNDFNGFWITLYGGPCDIDRIKYGDKNDIIDYVTIHK